MRNLEKLNLQELSFEEKRSVEGGWIGPVIALIALAAGLLAGDKDRG